MREGEPMISFRQQSPTALQLIWQGGSLLLLAIAVALSVNHLRPGGLPLVADWSPEAQLRLDSGESLAVSLDEAEMLFFSRSALFLDARSHDQFAEGHIEGALSLPWEDFDEDFARVLNGIPPETPLVTYCDGESCASSKELAMALLVKGYSNVRVLVNGWSVWQERSLPVETMTGTPRGVQ
jgi:rhodanese-related sulfurtransferase